MMILLGCTGGGAGPPPPPRRLLATTMKRILRRARVAGRVGASHEQKVGAVRQRRRGIRRAARGEGALVDGALEARPASFEDERRRLGCVRPASSTFTCGDDRVDAERRVRPGSRSRGVVERSHAEEVADPPEARAGMRRSCTAKRTVVESVDHALEAVTLVGVGDVNEKIGSGVVRRARGPPVIVVTGATLFRAVGRHDVVRIGDHRVGGVAAPPCPLRGRER